MLTDGNTEFVDRRLAELDILLAEWDERFEDVDLDRDEIALAAADKLLDEIERRQIVLQHDPRYLAACAAQAGQGAG